VSYFESRPVLVDVDADAEIEVHEVRDSEEYGWVVRLRIRPVVRVAGDKTLEVDVPVKAWRAFTKAVSDKVRREMRSA
jgi:hypothetical protein